MAKRYSRAYTSSRYNTSSNAYDYDTGIFEDDIERMRREAQKKEERENEIIKRKGFIHRIKFTATIFAVFAGCIVTMVTNAEVDRQRVENNKLRDELSQLKNENLNLQSEITDNTDLAYIEKEAKTRLSMTEPQPYQIVYIDVPKQSYTVQYSAQEKKAESSFGLKTAFSTLKDVLLKK